MASTIDASVGVAEALDAEYAIWFAKLEAVAGQPLVAEHWVGRWFDYYTPEQAWEDGPEDPTMPPTGLI